MLRATDFGRAAKADNSSRRTWDPSGRLCNECVWRLTQDGQTNSQVVMPSTSNVTHNTPRRVPSNGRTGFTHESDSSSVQLPDASKLRKPGRPSESTTSLDKTEIPVTLSSPLSTHKQPKHVAGVPSNNSSTIPSAAHRPRTPNTVGASQIQAAPSMSPSMSYRVPGPVTSLVGHNEGEPRPGPIMRSNSMRLVGQLHSAAVTPAAQDGLPSTRVPREIRRETSLKLARTHPLVHR